MATALVVAAAPRAGAQPTPPVAANALPAFSPPPPVAPAVIARDDRGGVTVRVTRLDEPLALDGRLDEAIYEQVSAFGDFIQQEPNEGQPATERSEVWVFYDDRHVYVAARYWKSNPGDLIANEMRKDESGIFRNDSIGVVLDTFYDRRSGYYFNTNALGAVRDALLVNENQNANLDFNPVWDVRSQRFAGGWSTEMAIPFKSLRYPARREQVWGLLIQRIDWKKNEFSYLTAVPPSYGGAGIWKVSSAATLVGIEAPVGGGRLELKPYALAGVSSDRVASPPVSQDLSAEAGFDARYRLTRGLSADFTYNTDFAQVEVDNQQLNLTRFSTFYPEKREFFLEMQNIMAFGPTTGPGGRRGPDDPTPLLFFSRQVGLADGFKVPVLAGGRVLGRVDEYTLGAFTIRTEPSPQAGEPATTFSVARVRRNVLARSSVGVLTTLRSPGRVGDSNAVVGFDGNFRFFQNVEINGYYAGSKTPGRTGDGTSHLAQFRYTGDRYGLEAARLGVGDAFNPEIGFLPRRDFTRHFGFVRYSPRPVWLPGVRKIGWEGSVDNITSTAGQLETRSVDGVFRVSHTSGDEWNITVAHTRDHPQAAFTVAGARVSPGAYRFVDVRGSYTMGPQRRIVGTLSTARGGFYGGKKSELGYSGRVSLTPQFMIEPTVTLSWLDMPQLRSSARLLGARTTFTVTPRMFVAALIQYSSSARTLGTNVRFRWEYRPGSDLFVVYGDGRDTGATGFPALQNRSIAIKFTRSFQM
ncbi:MAG: DUF5916 domain-containing protein [Vicinamibacterales bacterium]